ncbi:unnamed protein product, partial [Brachionus calyciflorus]
MYLIYHKYKSIPCTSKNVTIIVNQKTQTCPNPQCYLNGDDVLNRYDISHNGLARNIIVTFDFYEPWNCEVECWTKPIRTPIRDISSSYLNNDYRQYYHSNNNRNFYTYQNNSIQLSNVLKEK